VSRVNANDHTPQIAWSIGSLKLRDPGLHRTAEPCDHALEVDREIGLAETPFTGGY
jgi:hypothetical protein